MFIKHNFNNLYNSVKFVKLTNEELMWGKQKKSIDTNSTKSKFMYIQLKCSKLWVLYMVEHLLDINKMMMIAPSNLYLLL